VTPADLLGRIEMLDVACSKCERRGRYRVQSIIREVELDGRLTDWFEHGQSSASHVTANSWAPSSKK
jgi:hypothetical protein